MCNELRVMAKMDEAADELLAATHFAAMCEDDGASIPVLVRAISGASAKLSAALAEVVGGMND